MISRHLFVTRAAVGAAVLALAACESSQLTAPTGTAITFTSATTMVATQTLPITVNVIQGVQSANAAAATAGGGQPVHDGTVVSFTSTLGTVVPATATTTDGIVHIQLIGDGRTGAAKVTATSGAITGSTTITVSNSTVSSVSISLPGSAGVVSTPAVFTVGVGSSTGVTNVQVDFGDGSAVQSLGPVAANATTTVTHLYATPGVFTATATATGSDTGTAVGSTSVAIAALTLTPSGPGTVAAGTPASFTVTPTTGALIVQYTWDFGDATTAVTSTSNTQSHVYATTGSFTVNVTVSSSVGAIRVVQIPVTVV